MAYGISQARSSQSCSCWLMPQHQIPATSATYTTACGNAESLTHWVRPRIEATSSRTLVRFLTPWATQELLKILILILGVQKCHHNAFYICLLYLPCLVLLFPSFIIWGELSSVIDLLTSSSLYLLFFWNSCYMDVELLGLISMHIIVLSKVVFHFHFAMFSENLLVWCYNIFFLFCCSSMILQISIAFFILIPFIYVVSSIYYWFCFTSAFSCLWVW